MGQKVVGTESGWNERQRRSISCIIGVHMSIYMHTNTQNEIELTFKTVIQVLG